MQMMEDQHDTSHGSASLEVCSIFPQRQGYTSWQMGARAVTGWFACLGFGNTLTFTPEAWRSGSGSNRVDSR